MATQNLGRVVGSKIYTGSATDTNTIQTQLTSQGITPLIYDLYISTALVGIFQYQLVENVPTWSFIMRIKGDTGTFAISKTYNSVSAMNAGYATDGVPKGGLVLIDTGNVEDEDNAKLYVKGETAYDYLTDMSGAKGIKGDKGDKGEQGDKGATGSVFTPSVSDAGVLSWSNNGGLANPASVNIKGDKGAKGDKGEQGIQGEKGEKGDAGAKGDTGATGAQGSTGATALEYGNTHTEQYEGDIADEPISLPISGFNRTPVVGDKFLLVFNVTESGNTYIAQFTITAVGTDTASASLNGANPVNTTGATGAKGDKGDTGAKGETGATGATGADGKTPTLSINSNGELIATYA